MILPTKHLHVNRTLIGIGAEILALLNEPLTASRLWEDFRDSQSDQNRHLVGFDRFVLALDFLFLIEAIHFHRERVVKGPQR